MEKFQIVHQLMEHMAASTLIQKLQITYPDISKNKREIPECNVCVCAPV
jgi:hypothetical protein